MNQNLLIIDDSTAIHSLLRMRLKDEALAIHSATGGEQGLAMAGSIVPDVILLDLDMPGMDGLEVCRRLKADPNLMHIPVVLLVGAVSGEQKLRGLDLGAADLIAKPFDPIELRARVRAALRMKFLIDLLGEKAQIDSLTGLWTKRYFQQRLEAECSLARRAQRPLAVLIVEIDNLKAIQSRLGQVASDQVLRNVARTLSGGVRLEDIVCRYGTDQIAIITPNVAAIGPMAERLRQSIEAIVTVIRGEALPVSATIGAAAGTGDSIVPLAELAESALARARQSEANRIEIAAAPIFAPAA